MYPLANIYFRNKKKTLNCVFLPATSHLLIKMHQSQKKKYSVYNSRVTILSHWEEHSILLNWPKWILHHHLISASKTYPKSCKQIWLTRPLDRNNKYLQLIIYCIRWTSPSSRIRCGTMICIYTCNQNSQLTSLTKQLFELRSRWMILELCKYSIPAAISRAIDIRFLHGNLPTFFMWFLVTAGYCLRN